MSKSSFFILDVFTDRKYAGNPLAIFPDARAIPSSQFQDIAKELNLSETVFLFPKNGEGQYPMRIFTPKMELPTAGHPSVGTAWFIAREYLKVESGKVNIPLLQSVGVVNVEVVMELQQPVMATMYPPLPKFGQVIQDRATVADLLSLDASQLLELPIQIISCGVPYLIIPVRKLQDVASVHFNLSVWQKFKNEVNGAFVYVFCPEAQESTHHVHGRMFAPEAGVPEDPATGSANGPLMAYLSFYGIFPGPIISEQGYEMGRPSQLYLNAERLADGKYITISVGGKCVMVGNGTIFPD